MKRGRLLSRPKTPDFASAKWSNTEVGTSKRTGQRVQIKRHMSGECEMRSFANATNRNALRARSGKGVAYLCRRVWSHVHRAHSMLFPPIEPHPGGIRLVWLQSFGSRAPGVTALGKCVTKHNASRDARRRDVPARIEDQRECRTECVPLETNSSPTGAQNIRCDFRSHLRLSN